ncbi:MAG: hypothetical protein K0R28_5558 [Paenibacillus sp.]|nr:hypothetical protein [Paenibacillus sp.]
MNVGQPFPYDVGDVPCRQQLLDRRSFFVFDQLQRNVRKLFLDELVDVFLEIVQHRMRVKLQRYWLFLQRLRFRLLLRLCLRVRLGRAAVIP